jgi:hypothetical protein
MRHEWQNNSEQQLLAGRCLLPSHGVSAQVATLEEFFDEESEDPAVDAVHGLVLDGLVEDCPEIGHGEPLGPEDRPAAHKVVTV